MNTKKYKAFYAQLAEEGAIPRELYEKIIAEINAAGKMTRGVYVRVLELYEQNGLFNTPTVPYNTKKSAQTDGTYKYKRTKNPFWHIAHWFWSVTFRLIGYIGGAIVFGVWRVKDKKKLKGIGACITTSNHVEFLDAVLTIRARGFKRQYIISSPYNCKRTVGGAILRSAGIVPLPVSLKGTRAFDDMLGYIKDKKGAIHFYPEQCMWRWYEKPRPYKEGSFFYADKLNIPVVPMLYCFKKPRGLRKLLHLYKAVIKIGDPIYPDQTKKPRERRAELCEKAFAAAKQMYEDFYGRPLEYAVADVDQTNKEENE